MAQLNGLIANAVGQLFPDDIWVEGEISNLNRSAKGHVYFDLVEPTQPGQSSAARISVVLWNSTKQIVNKQLKRENVGAMTDGMAVRLRSAVDFYEVQGRLQLRMTGIDPRYILAAMAAERDALIERLHNEGVAEQNKLRPMPLVPLRVGLVTSAGSDAEKDFLDELHSSAFGFLVTVCDARVQGDEAPAGLARSLTTLFCRNDLDVIVLTRGGGSRGDLAVFDNEALARTIARSPVPVITGIGHEADRSVADVVAHTAVKTPTAAAGLLVDRVARVVEHTEACWHGIQSRTSTTLAHAEQQLDLLARRSSRAGRDGLLLADQRLTATKTAIHREAIRTLAQATEQLDRRSKELPKLARRTLRHASSSIDHHQARLKTFDPAIMLERGWTITRTANGDVVRSVADANSGDTLVTQLADGTLISNVSVINKDPEQ